MVVRERKVCYAAVKLLGAILMLRLRAKVVNHVFVREAKIQILEHIFVRIAIKRLKPVSREPHASDAAVDECEIKIYPTSRSVISRVSNGADLLFAHQMPWTCAATTHSVGFCEFQTNKNVRQKSSS